MRCPKCGYNSFDHLENCKKCGKDLSQHKSRFGIRSVMLPDNAAEEEELVLAEEETVAADGTSEAQEPVAAPVAKESPEEQAEGFEFDFISGKQETDSDGSPEEILEESDAFDLEHEQDETLPEDPEALAEEDFSEDTGEPVDKEELSLDQPDLGQDEAETAEGMVSEATELGLDESDLANFDKKKLEGSTEAPDHPFGGKKNLQQKGSSTIEKAVQAAQTSADEPVDFLTDSDPDEDTQEKLFASDEELPPLPDTQLEEAPLESLEATYGNGSYDRTAAGESDDFTLGAMSAAKLADIPEVNTVETPQQEDEYESDSTEEADMDLEDSEETEQPTGIAPPFARRLSAFLCDIILIGLVGLCFIVVAETALSENPAGMLPTAETLIDLSIPYFLVVFCLTFGYFTLFHFLTGQTPGKMVTGMRVETFSGEALAFSQAFMRSVGGLIQILPAGLGYLTILNAEGRGWNDRLAGTRLVDLKSSEEPQEDEAEEEVEEEIEEPEEE